MANGTWKRTTTASRRAERKLKYVHTSVLVGVTTDPVTGGLIPSRTPKGEGSTATRKEPKSKARAQKGHDWSGIYFGKPASLEKLRRDRRNARKHARRFAGSLLADALAI
jgi:hypothetical protein